VIVGSNESVSVQSRITFPAADNDNSILSFAFMKNGISLEDASTTCTFNSVYPFLGALDLRGGMVILQQDFVLQGLIPFISSGFYIGNGNNIDYSNCQLTPIVDESIDSIYQDANVLLSKIGDFTLTHTLIFRGNCSLAGASPSVTGLSSNAVLMVDSNSSLTIKNMVLNGVQAQNIRCVDDTASIVFDNVTIIQSGDYSFSTGSMSFVNNVDWQGSFTFLYDSTQSSTIQSESIFLINGGLTLSTGRFADSAIEPLVFTDQTSVLSFDNATLNINSHGARFTKGTFETTNIVTIDVNSTSTATALEFGDNITADDILFQFNGGSITNFNSGIVVFNVTTFSIPAVAGGNVTVKQGPTNINYFAQNYELNNIILNLSPLAQTIIAPGKQLLLNNVTSLTANGGSFVVTGFYNPGIGFLLEGNQSMDIVSGSIAFALLIDNQGNILTGAGNITFPIVLLDSGTELIWDLTGQLQTDLIVNGGSISLSANLNIGHSVLLTGGGTVHLNNFTLYPGNISYNPPHSTWSDPIYWDGSVGSISLSSDLTLDSTWTFSGETWVIGNGFEFDLTNGDIVVEKGSTIHFHNISITGLISNNIRCLDDAGTVILEGCTLTLDGNFTFTLGNLAFRDPAILQGNAIFAFQSDQPCTFNDTAKLILDTGMTFSYDAASPDLLQFDPMAQIVLNGGNFFAAQDLNLIHATLLVQPFGALSSSATSTITLGDCANPANDFSVIVTGGAQLDVNQGTLNYKNLNVNSWLMQNFFSNLLMSDGTALNLYQSLNAGTGFATFGNSVLGTSPNMGIIGAVNEQGVLTFVALPSC
ncbi:MAG: hypothetical protein P4L31_02820, partial [Candidatus Babeliales bacterium]|nr:hypothetical protein [Candidatus Babeliales bacterium]